MPKASSLRVLIVDDQQSVRGICRYTLNQIGFSDIAEAASGREALRWLEQKMVDLIISDWNMPEIDGITLLKVIRHHPRTARLPFIMATSRSDRDQVREAISCGVNNYIVKPYDAATMRAKIEAVVGVLA